MIRQETHLLISWASAVGKFGWLGVPVFFVLSGYCMTQSIERHAANGLGVLSFWRDRLLRIYPVYWCALLFACVLALLATPFNRLPVVSAFPDTPLAWISDLGLVTAWTNVTPHLTVSWTLDYEIGFYVLVGLALLARRAQRGARLAFYLGLTVCSLLPGIADALPLLGNWPQFACGIAAWIALHRPLPRWQRGIALLALVLFAIWQAGAHGWTAAVAPLAALGLCGTIAFEDRLPRAPRLLTSIGVASFSIYLMHVPVMSPALNLVHRLLPRTGIEYVALWTMHLMLGVFAGWLFHRQVERRFEKLRNRHKHRLRLVPLASPATPLLSNSSSPSVVA